MLIENLIGEPHQAGRAPRKRPSSESRGSSQEKFLTLKETRQFQVDLSTRNGFGRFPVPSSASKTQLFALRLPSKENGLTVTKLGTWHLAPGPRECPRYLYRVAVL